MEEYPVPETSGEKGELKLSHENTQELAVSREEIRALAEAQAAKDKAAEEKILAELFDEDGDVKESEYLTITAELIRGVDYETLKDIFEGMRRRSGVSGEIGFCGPEKIVINDGWSGGEYDFHNGITIGSSPLSRQEEHPISRAEFQNEILSTLIHEETHASSKNLKENPTGGKRLLAIVRSLFKKSDPYRLSGYDRTQLEKSRTKRAFTDFNEGVTDKIAEEVYGEYLQRTGETAKVSDKDRRAEYHVAAYLGSRAVVTAFVEIIAASSELPKQAVWEAIKQGYFTGIDLRQTELQQALEEVFSEGFSDRLSQWGAGEEGKIHTEILEKAKHADISKEGKTRIKVAFELYQSDVERRSRSRK